MPKIILIRLVQDIWDPSPSGITLITQVNADKTMLQDILLAQVVESKGNGMLTMQMLIKGPI